MIRRFLFSSLAFVVLAHSAACGNDPSVTEGDAKSEDNFTSNQASLLTFEFAGEVETDFGFGNGPINDQLLYTIGQLNGSKAVGRLDKVVLTDVVRRQEGGKTIIAYKAKLPVSWGSQTNLPRTYEFNLPRNSSSEGQTAFTERYKHSCAEFGAHDVDAGSMWYYYRPAQSGCAVAAADTVKMTATISKSTENTTGKYPEYDKVWADGELNVVSIFGKYADTGTTPADAGISAYNTFLRTMRSELGRFTLTTEPATVPVDPSVALKDVTFRAVLPDGKKINVTALLVDNIGSVDAAFNTRYNGLSTNADVIAYNGHAGLGQNVRALAQKGNWKKGQYVIVFMNGCDTFAYVDGSLAQTRARVNTDDPTGTKYMEFITNTLPAFFANMPNSTSTLIKGLARFDSPMTYEQIFDGIDDSQIVVVTGEEDNTYTPGVTPPPAGWQGLSARVDGFARGAERRFETGVLQPGRYEMAIKGTGDADLYVKVGQQATKQVYDCRPFKSGSNEICVVNVTQAANISVLVRGYATSSSFDVTGKKL
jgi:hypothetical protein